MTDIREPYLAQGARSHTVLAVQTALQEKGFYLNARTDGIFGPKTDHAVKTWQLQNAHTADGKLTPDQLHAVDHKIDFSLFARCLAVVAAWEHDNPLHGFSAVYGNFDTALITYGIIGMTWHNGELPEFLIAVNNCYPDLIKESFGPNAASLIEEIRHNLTTSRQYAKEKLLLGRQLRPWAEHGFRALGNYPEIQQIQIKHAENKYWLPAITQARRLGFKSPNGFLLCFDAAVQGGFSAVKRFTFDALNPEANITKLADTIDDVVYPRWRTDKRERSMIAATGSGNAQGRQYDLTSWGFYSTDELKQFSSPAASEFTRRSSAARAGEGGRLGEIPSDPDQPANPEPDNLPEDSPLNESSGHALARLYRARNYINQTISLLEKESST